MPQDSPAATGDPAWHQALAYAVTGRRLAELGRQDRPDLPWLTDYLRRLIADGTDRQGQSGASAAVARVPADLLIGIGAAQFCGRAQRAASHSDSDGPHPQQPVVAGPAVVGR